MPRVGPSSPGLSISAQVIVHLSHLNVSPLSFSLSPSLSRSLGLSLSFSHPRFNAVVPCCAYSSASFFIQQRTLIPSTVQLRYLSLRRGQHHILICCPCPWNPHIFLIIPYNPLLYKHVSPFNLCRCIELRMHVSYLGK